MKVLRMKEVDIDACVQAAQGESIVLTKNGSPVAVVLGVEGMDLEQVELSQSSKFWKLIKERRKRPTISRKELEKRLSK